MKQRILSLFCALCMVMALLPGGVRAAGGAFTDIPDAGTAAAAESLRLMGVLDGYGDGTFRPEGTLNRAQFCKMVIRAIGAEKKLGRYTTVTVFPDVKPSHWAAAYINLAALGEKIIAGYADGYFHPERSLTLGHAATILLRLLGYKDEDVGGVWPSGYLATAESTGLLDGVGTKSAQAVLTRAQAARLFVNFIRADTADGSPYFTLTDETTLNSLDAGGKLVTPEKTYEMEYPQTSTTLTGSRGRVVLKGEKALTFLPLEADGSASSAGVLILSGNGSAAGLSALTGGRSGYSVYKNGTAASLSDIRAGDVATFSPSDNALHICDTRVSARYENCVPSPEAPSTIQILNGTEFSVLPAAVDSLSRFRPGKVLTFLLTADGRIAGAEEGTGTSLRGNAVVVRTDSGVKLLCGGGEIAVGCSIPEQYGLAAKLSCDKDGNLTFSALGKAASGGLNAVSRTLGSRKLAPNVRIYGEGGIIAQEDWDGIAAGDITGSRLNWAGQVDLVTVGGRQGASFYGLAEVKKVRDSESVAVPDDMGRDPDDEDWEPTYREDGSYTSMLTVTCNGQSVGPFPNEYNLKDGTMVEVRVNRAGTRYVGGSALRKLSGVSEASWVGDSAVTYGGKTYSVSKDLPCYNRDAERWITLDAARKYAKTAALYVSGDAVRIMEVGG